MHLLIFLAPFFLTLCFFFAVKTREIGVVRERFSFVCLKYAMLYNDEIKKSIDFLCLFFSFVHYMKVPCLNSGVNN